jgi:phosphoglycerate-specific signal transduction histidine kinase
MRAFRLLLALALGAALIAGCGGQSKADKAQDQVCSARDDIAKQVDTLKGLSITTATTDQVSKSLQAIQDDLSKISNAMGDLADDKRKDVQAANDQFKSSVQDITSNLGKNLSLSNAATQFKQALQQLASSYKSTFGQLDCS